MGTTTPNLSFYLPADGEGHPPSAGSLDHDWSGDVNNNFTALDSLLAFGLNGIYTKALTGLSANPATAAGALDARFSSPRSALLALDVDNMRLWVRVGTLWRYAALFISPAQEASAGVKFNLTDASTVSVDASTGTYFVLSTNASRTIDAPSSPSVAQEISFDIMNSAGSALISWNGIYKLAGAWTNPASGKRRLIKFIYDGTSWVELTRTGADV